MPFDFNIHDTIKAFLILFAIINIPAILPIVINLQKRNNIIKPAKAGITSFIIFVGFFFFGKGFLSLFNISLPSFGVAGAIIIFIIAMKMIMNIQPKNSVLEDDTIKKTDSTIVPIVFPLIADAGTLTTLITIKNYYNDINIIIAAFLNCFLIYFFLKFAKKIEKKVNLTFLQILQKVFGIILLAIAVEMFIDNIVEIVETYIQNR